MGPIGEWRRAEFRTARTGRFLGNRATARPSRNCLVSKNALKTVGALRAVLPAMTCSINVPGAEVCLATPAVSSGPRQR